LDVAARDRAERAADFRRASRHSSPRASVRSALSSAGVRKGRENMIAASGVSRAANSAVSADARPRHTHTQLGSKTIAG